MQKQVRFFFFGIIFLLGALQFSVLAEDKPFDYVIKGALVFNGESLVPIKEDLALSGNRIVEIGKIPSERGGTVIDAEGLVAAPGFIDMHTHSDFNPFVYPNLGNKVFQGVTTEVVGNCGMSATPVEGFHTGEIANVWRREGVEIPQPVPWESVGEYQSESEVRGLDTNFVSLVGHGNLRSAVIGMDPRAATTSEIEAMRKLLDEALSQGAFGVSFGLSYLPGIFATHEEIVTLCREAGRHKGLCAFHIRSEGGGLLESIQEAIDIGREAGAAVHISHLKAGGKNNWGKITEAFRKIEKAQAEGFSVTSDAYPYTAGFAELGVILPDELYKDPNRNQRFKDPLEKNKIIQTLESYYAAHPVSWDSVRIATVTQEKNSAASGKSILERSREIGKSPVEVLVDLLADEDFKVSAFYFSQSESVMNQVLLKPYVAVGSDSIADGSVMPHPRAYGTFPRVLVRCQKEKGILGNSCWGKTIHQMTGLPAKILGLKKRGRIEVGFYADLVLLDPVTLQDRADYVHPKTLPQGIPWVFVNGKPEVKEGKYEAIHSGLFVTSEK